MLGRIFKAWFMLISRKAPQFAKDRRLICADCPHNKWGVCRKCGCPIVAKSLLTDEECPENKWP